MRLSLATLSLTIPTLLAAQQTERITLDGPEVAIYNLVGKLHVEGGTGDRVVVEVTRGGRDAGRLTLETSSVRGRAALRVQYPEDRIYYAPSPRNSRSTFTVSDDGTFGDAGTGWRDGRRRIEVSSRGDGLDAHADLRVVVPRGKTLFLRQGVGETSVENVDGKLNVDVAASHVTVSHTRGSLSLDTGSGGVEITDVTGDLTLDSGSGGATLDGVRGGKLNMEVGSGSLRGRAIDVTELVAEVGSGGVRLSGVKTPRLHLETGSGGSEVELLTPTDDVSIEAGSGGVTLRMPAATSATVDIETGSGGIDSDFDVKVSRVERRALRGTIGTGKGRIKIESGSGAVRLLKG
jgi:lia operon protein LiaG